jgi:hypothetical protein
MTALRSLQQPPHDASRVYRDAHALYRRAFVRGDVGAIEEAFSRMQEIGRAFEEGAKWAQTQSSTTGKATR